MMENKKKALPNIYYFWQSLKKDNRMEKGLFNNHTTFILNYFSFVGIAH